MSDYYRLYFLGEKGHIVAHAEWHDEGDTPAIEKSRTLLCGRAAELWCGKRVVARFSREESTDDFTPDPGEDRGRNQSNGTTDTAFSSVVMNGVTLTTNSTGTIDEKSLIHVAVNPGLNMLIVNRTSGGLYSYGRSTSFAKLARGVPKPASWALMILDFGWLGAALRAKRRTLSATA